MNRTDSFVGAPWDELRKGESFTVTEDFPKREPYHDEERVRNAVSPAMLVVAANGKEYLLVQRN